MSIFDVGFKSNVNDRRDAAFSNKSLSRKSVDITTLNGHAVIILSPELTQEHTALLNSIKNNAQSSSVNSDLTLFLKKLSLAGKRQVLGQEIKQVGSRKNALMGNGATEKSIKALAKESEATISDKIKSGQLTQEKVEAAGKEAVERFINSQTSYESEQKKLTRDISLPQQQRVAQQNNSNSFSNQGEITNPTANKNVPGDGKSDIKDQKEKIAEQRRENLEKDTINGIKKAEKEKERLTTQQKNSAVAKIAQQRMPIIDRDRVAE